MGKKNIRLDALPRDRRSAERDCRRCIKRRIQCDRTLPTCHKCASRGIECPGFEQSLKWVDGLANRGKAKDKKRTLQAANATSGESNDAAILFQHGASLVSRDLGLGSRSMLETLSSRLVSHFLVHVTPRLQWVDHENPWRHLLFPLSRTSIPLQLAIMSLSAAHLSVIDTTASEHVEAFRRIHETLLHQTLQLTTVHIRHQLADGASESATDVDIARKTSTRNTEMLATMFVLCHLEMLFPESHARDIHLQAFRIASERERLYRSQVPADDPLVEFLQRAVASIHSVFKFPTTSQPDEKFMSNTTIQQPTFGDRIWAFTTILREISDLETETRHEEQDVVLSGRTDMQSWHSKFNLAYMVALSSTSNLWTTVSATRTVFCKVVNAHYYAGLIYSYQALASLDERLGPVVTSAVTTLIQELQNIRTSTVREFDQDLFWPLFIAGTECGTSKVRQKLVDQQFLEVVTSTGLWCNSKALRFLKLLWGEESRDPAISWIQYARNCEEEFGSFLVY